MIFSSQLELLVVAGSADVIGTTSFDFGDYPVEVYKRLGVPAQYLYSTKQSSAGSGMGKVGRAGAVLPRFKIAPPAELWYKETSYW